MNKNSTYNLIYSLWQNHDSSVFKWKESLSPIVNIEEVMNIEHYLFIILIQSVIDSGHLMIIASFEDNNEVEDDGFNVVEADSSASSVSSEDADALAHANNMSPVHSIDKDSIVAPSFSNLSDGILIMCMHL